VQYLKRSDYPADIGAQLAASDGEVVIRGGSVIVNPQGRILAGPSRNGECILTADLNLDEIVEGKYDLDVAGHYSRPDIFRFEVRS
jgi:nitrilase